MSKKSPRHKKPRGARGAKCSRAYGGKLQPPKKLTQKELLIKALGSKNLSKIPKPLVEDEKFLELVERISRGRIPIRAACVLVENKNVLVGELKDIFDLSEGIPLIAEIEAFSFPDTHGETSQFMVTASQDGNLLYLQNQAFGALSYRKNTLVYLVPNKIAPLPADMRKWDTWQSEYYIRQPYHSIGRAPGKPKYATSLKKASVSNLVQLRRTNVFPSPRQLRKERDLSSKRRASEIDVSFSLE